MCGQVVVAAPAIGQHRRAMLHHITHERHQTGTRGIRHTTHPDAAEARGRKNLDGDDDDGLTSRTATTLAASFLPATERFIDFHLAAEAVATSAHHRCPKAVQHRPGRLVGTEAQEPVQSLGRDAVRRRGHVPGDREPDRERRACAVENGSCGHRHPTPAALAPEPPVTHPPTAGGLAARAHEAVRPAQPLDIVEASLVVGEPRTQLCVATRVVAAGPQTGGRPLRRHPYILCQPHSDGYPHFI